MAIESIDFTFDSSLNYRNYIPAKAPVILYL